MVGSQGIEDVEQSASDKLFGRQKPPIFDQKVENDESVSTRTWHKIFPGPSNSFIQTEHSNSRVGVDNEPSWKKYDSASKASTIPELDYHIDPISNRRVYDNSKEHSNPKIMEIPVKGFKGHMSQPSNFDPFTDHEVSSDCTNVKSVGPRHEYSNVEGSWRGNAPDASGSEIEYHTPNPSTPSKLNDESPPQMDPVKNNFLDYDINRPPQPEGSSHGQRDRQLIENESSYNPSAYSKLDGALPEHLNSVTLGLNDYDHQYKPSTYSEPDGKLLEQPVPMSKGISDASFASNEPKPGTSGSTKIASSSSKEDTAASVSQQDIGEDIGEEHKSTLSSHSLFESFNTAGTDKVDDLSLLSASEIRAASGKVKKSQTKSDVAFVAQESSSTTPEPTRYKILAYDPTMQVINVAETTSTATDSFSALTPPEVLLRLSNPARFFPHFQPLQAQGYEIVSGSGDVLVFRKVRDADPTTPQESSTGSTTTSSLPSPRKFINPIDGMQCILQPATGNFASPTGFVNHDLPSEPPFVSSINDRREEPAFSGRKTAWPEDELGDGLAGRETRKTGRKLLIGAAWVAACSYAVGVVSEFFKTGGSDGRGPVGF